MSDMESQSEDNEKEEGTPSPTEQPIRWYINSTHWAVVMSRDVLAALAIVAVIGGVLVGITGVWPPLVAVESGSMEPNIQEGDLVLVVDNERFVHDAATDDGIVTQEDGENAGHERFGAAGSVIVFQPTDESNTPVIHRVERYVEAGDNWTDGLNVSCEEVENCVADRSGYITKGDANDQYDQARSYEIVEKDQIRGKALIRIPYLGRVRLLFN